MSFDPEKIFRYDEEWLNSEEFDGMNPNDTGSWIHAKDYDSLLELYLERKMLHLRFVDAFDNMRSKYYAMEDRALAAESNLQLSLQRKISG